MPNCFVSFLKGRDQLGQGVHFSHKNKFGIGTAVGGACSLLVTLFFTLFASIELYAWLFAPAFS